MKNPHKLVVIGVILFILDQLTKHIIRTLMQPSQSIPIIQNIFHITFVKNTGALFGILKGFSFAFIWLTIIALGFIMFYWDKFPKKFISKLFLVFIIVGLVGNLIDRIFFGYVIDFIDIRIWPVFNIADSLVSAGVAGLIFSYVKK